MERKRMGVPSTPMSCESDYEFWEDFERKPVLRLPKELEIKGNDEAVKLLSNPRPEKATSGPAVPSVPVNLAVENFSGSKPLPQKEDAHADIHFTPEDSPKSVTQEEASPQMPEPSSLDEDSDSKGDDEHEEEHVSEKREWQSKCDSITAEMKTARNEASRLQTIVFEQEMTITRLRGEISEMRGAPALRPSKKKELALVDLSTDTKVLKSQIEAFGDLLDYFQKQADDYKKANAQLASELGGIQSKHNQELAKLKESLREKEEKITSERDKLLVDLKEFRENAVLEARAREELNVRQMKFIESLQEELKLAKSVLQNPRLRNIMRERLKDYKEVLAQQEPSSMPPQPKPPAHSKSVSWSARVAKGWLRVVDPGDKIWVPKVNQSVDEVSRRETSPISGDGRKSVEVETDPVFTTPPQGVSLPKLLQRQYQDKL